MQKALLISLLLSTSVLAQTPAIEGRITDRQQKPVPFATIALMNAADSALVKVAVGTESGTYSLTGVKAGTYRVGVTSVGYEKAVSTPFAFDGMAKKIIPDILLNEGSRLLNEVSVKARKPLVEVQADKLVLNVESSLTAAGSAAIELLQKAPGLQVDPNDNLTLQGKNGVRLYIDGRPSPLGPADQAAYLRTLQASDIEAIEIITQPSARYDAAGNAGIINIRLKKNKNFGTNGSLTAGFAQGRYFPKYNGSVSLNHRTKKVNLFGTYSQRNARDWSFINLYREQSNLFFDQRSQSRFRSAGGNLKAGADFFLNAKSTFGVLINGNLRHSDGTTQGRTPIGPLDKQPTQILLADNQNESDRSNWTGNLNYRYADTTGRELNVDADYGFFRSASEAFQPNRYVNPETNVTLFERNYRMNTLTNIDLYTLKADYTQRLWKGRLSTGFKAASVRTDNGFDFFDLIDNRPRRNTDRSNQFDYTETITAGYVSYDRSAGKWQWQAGLRLEHTHSDGRLTSETQQADARVVRRYANLFPSAGLTYRPDASNSLGLTYSRRIDRPTYQSLNPFESKLDELTYQKGNAFLRPQYTNTVQASHTYKYKLTTSLSFSRIDDFFTEITDTIETSGSQPRNYITTRNLARQDVVSLNISYPFSLTKWWNVYLNVSAYRSTNRADFGAGRLIRLTANVLSLYAQHTLTLPRKWNLELSAFYTSPSLWGGTFRNRRFWGSSIGLQRKVLADRGSVNLTVADPFNSQRWRGISQFGGLYMDASGGWESQQVRVNLTWNFGRQQIKAARQRRTGSEEESKRL